MSKLIINEQELNKIIEESIKKCLNESDIEEGFLGDKWKQVKSAGKTALQGGSISMKDRFSNAKKNYNSQGELNNLNNLIQNLSAFVDNGQIDPQTTVAQLIGGKYNKGKFGKMSAMRANRMSQINKRGGQTYEEE